MASWDKGNMFKWLLRTHPCVEWRRLQRNTLRQVTALFTLPRHVTSLSDSIMPLRRRHVIIASGIPQFRSPSDDWPVIMFWCQLVQWLTQSCSHNGMNHLVCSTFNQPSNLKNFTEVTEGICRGSSSSGHSLTSAIFLRSPFLERKVIGDLPISITSCLGKVRKGSLSRSTYQLLLKNAKNSMHTCLNTTQQMRWS